MINIFPVNGFEIPETNEFEDCKKEVYKSRIAQLTSNNEIPEKMNIFEECKKQLYTRSKGTTVL